MAENIENLKSRVENLQKEIAKLKSSIKKKFGLDRWILQPEDEWEIIGYVHNVVFSCGAVPEDDGTLKLYWGGADKVMCAGTAVIEELVGLCLTDSRPPL